MDYYGPLPELSELDAGDAETTRSPILMWRFALNMDRQRLILYDINEYISDPSLILEPPYILALLLLFLLFWRIKRDIAAQFAVGCRLPCFLSCLTVGDAADWLVRHALDFVAFCVAAALCVDLCVSDTAAALAGRHCFTQAALVAAPHGQTGYARFWLSDRDCCWLDFYLWPGITANIKKSELPRFVSVCVSNAGRVV